MENKFDTSDLFMNGENHRGKTPQGEFKVTTPENPLIWKQGLQVKESNTLYQPVVKPLP